MNNNDNNSIHDFDFSLICEYFSSTDHQGPGSEEATLRALSFIPGISADTKIADLGCGTGSSTLVLAKHTEAHIIALDLFPQFIDKLKVRVNEAGVAQSVDTVVGSMELLPFEKEYFDIIWSEGAIYNIGFDRGMKEWNGFLKKGGYIAVTEASWFTDERPEKIEQFWLDAYPEMDTIAHKIAQMQGAGYKLVAAFVLPDECWTINYYGPQHDAQKHFLKKHAGNGTAESLVANMVHESELYEKYGSYYGYVFYIGQKL